MVGHSLGGYESLLLKDREPSKVVGMVLVDPSFPDQPTVIQRAAPTLAHWDRANPPPFIPILQKCGAALRAGTLRSGDPDPDGCLRAMQLPIFPPELRAALDKVSVEAAPATYAADLETMAFYGSKQLIELDSKLVIKPDRNYGNMPLIILTAGDVSLPPDLPTAVNAELPAYRAAWRGGHDALAALSTRGVNRVVPDTTHYIQLIKPQTVIDAIDEVVDEARTSSAESESSPHADAKGR